MLLAENMYVGYDGVDVVKNFNYHFEKGKISTIIGPNGSGKSTVLKAVSRLLKTSSGDIRLNEKDIKSYKTKSLSQMMAVLSQVNYAPSDFSVRDLVSFGRAPYRRWYEVNSREDDKVVDWAIEVTRLGDLQHKRVVQLSGGERQRAWIAMALSQQPKVLLLDEPTTYLDVCHQFEVMELVKDLNKTLGLTVVMVLHDLNQASIYSDNICLLRKGEIVCHGCPRSVMTPEIIKDVFNVRVDVSTDDLTGKTTVIPRGL
ncbi:ABC transporter ATP-binding protein [Acidaminobacter sp. JC074]|uniref:ABC transporter ATP-binding protein n=1 Tax=Acidaminobacter sp. JC074 TaxID=2530199 RepID=UPI001F0DD690|nr:ABC transporter ATP-binding protein [Acidaminobacter sp. JC074]MCH4891040.1 ABC transporter ATP-binding protein [Acidaminobacter sp. JC074]